MGKTISITNSFAKNIHNFACNLSIKFTKCKRRFRRRVKKTLSKYDSYGYELKGDSCKIFNVIIILM